MYFSSSRATANESYFTFSVCPVSDYCQYQSGSNKLTSSLDDNRLFNFGGMADRDESIPIRFTFDHNTANDKPLYSFDDLRHIREEKAISSYPEELELVLQTSTSPHKNRLQETATEVSPTTPSNPLGANDTKSTISKDADFGDAEAATSFAPAFTYKCVELDQICDTVNSPKTDLNKYVEDILFFNEEPSVSNEACQVQVTKKNKKRMRKSAFQVKILEQEFKSNQDWTKEDMKAVCTKSGLEHSQVYKWYWDQLRKQGTKPRCW